MRTGLVSVSFRKLTPEEIVPLAAQCGLGGIEWGGDIHVPCGEIAVARRVGEMTREAGLTVDCYGSYFRATRGEEIGPLVETALALGAPRIRIWAGVKGSREATGEDRVEVIEAARELAGLAAKAGLDVAFEWHGGTLTDTAESARALLDAIGMANVGCLWQPPVDMSVEGCLAGIELAKPYIRHVHVFSWAGGERLPLADGAEKWRACLGALPEDVKLLMEFVKDDDPDRLRADAQTLHRWLKGDWT